MRNRLSAVLAAVMAGLAVCACGSAAGRQAPAETGPETAVEEEKEESEEIRAEETGGNPDALIIEEPANSGIPVYTLGSSHFSEFTEDYYTIAYGENETIALTEDAAEAYPALQETVEAFSEKAAADFRESYEEIKNSSWEAWESLDEKTYDFPPGSVTMSIEPVRCDGEILSFFVAKEYFYSGAAHGFTVYDSRNYDPSTGREIQLTDIFRDPASLAETAQENLHMAWDGSPVTDAWEDLSIFFSGNTDDLVWAIDEGGVTFRFAPGQISYYAAGTLESRITFAQNPEVFTERFHPAAGTFVKQLNPYMQTFADLDGDGREEALKVTGIYDDEDDPYMYSGLEVTVDGRSCVTEEWFFSMNPVLLHMEDGRNYIYAEVTSENDYNSLLVCEIRDGVPGQAARMEGLGYAASYSFDESELSLFNMTRYPLLDPAGFMLDKRINLMSTYSGMREYEAGPDGLPVPKTEYYMIPEGRRLISKAALTADAVDPRTGSLTGGKTEIPAGTFCTLWRTNGEDTVDLLLEDGRAVRVNVSREWPQTVNGLDLEETFDGVMFAG